MLLFRSLFCAIGLAGVVYAKSSKGDSVLVVVEPKQQDNYSIFFNGLRGASKAHFFSKLSYILYYRARIRPYIPCTQS